MGKALSFAERNAGLSIPKAQLFGRGANWTALQWGGPAQTAAHGGGSVTGGFN